MKLMIVALALATPACGDPAVIQPIEFNHGRHVKDQSLPCELCHKTVKTSAISGRPTIATCAMCHSASMGESAEAEKVHGYVERGEEIAWLRLYRVPTHVRYSHYRHVEVGAIPCLNCHGAIGESQAPPHLPLVDLTMDFCLDCHRDRGVSTDCIACHM